MYLTQVSDGKLPVNHPIIYQLQDVFNLLPNLNVPDLMKAFTVKTNDQNLVSFVVGVSVCVCVYVWLIYLLSMLVNSIYGEFFFFIDSGKLEN